MFLAAERSQEELHAAMRKSFAVVNSSVSEGMSAAILEVCVFTSPVPSDVRSEVDFKVQDQIPDFIPDELLLEI